MDLGSRHRNNRSSFMPKLAEIQSHTASFLSRMAQPQPILPRGAWDSHLHIVDPERWPLADDAPYTPKKADLDACLAFERSIGIDHICIIAMSIYGTDNRCSIDALKRLSTAKRAALPASTPTLLRTQSSTSCMASAFAV
ncbi:hypothetical protein B0H14DRAFT_1160271 [Mycena olivaceomarginata]|nr:hypothetical protein B0H14DRAFT_1160271 [Mycena olivaceomarginata]